MSAADDLDQIALRLNQVSREALPRARTIIRTSLTNIQAGAKARAPVDTGYLRSSISTAMQGNAHMARGEVGPTANYGGHVELGTRRQRAQPYLRPATDEEMPAFDAAAREIGSDL